LAGPTLPKYEEKEPQPDQQTFFLLTRDCPKGRINTTMIRLFAALCKTLLDYLNEEQVFQDATDGYIHHGKGCPNCGARGQLSLYGGYFRWLVFRRKRRNVEIRIWIRRFECKSCGATHALLPDILTPYSIYSLHFKLVVLIAYFERDCTVAALCESFGIAVSTLYAWKELLAAHKELMIGVLLNQKTPALDFLRDLIDSVGLSDALRSFYRKYGFSFMQVAPVTATRSNPP